MSLDTNVELLKQIPIFSGLSDKQLTAIAAVGRKCFFAEGEALIKDGDTGETAYIILSGKAEIKGTPNSGVNDDVLIEGTLVGELAMLVEMTYTATVTALERVRALAIDRKALYGVMEKDPSVAQHFSDKLMKRMLDLADQLREVDAQFAAIEASLETADVFAQSA